MQLTLFPFGHAQTTKTDDPRTQKRCGLPVTERGWQRKHEVPAGDRVLRVPTVHAIPGKDGCVAEALKASLAVPTIPIDTPDPGNPNTRASRELARSCLHDVADKLMARNDSFTLGRKLASTTCRSVRQTPHARKSGGANVTMSYCVRSLLLGLAGSTQRTVSKL